MLEAIENSDCMCLCLDIRRTEATIADPSRLIIKNIIPTYLTASSFIESATRELQMKGPKYRGYFD